ncbi:hypothetical protein GKE82_01270 [Conexibacter sp. W3-3-2]|nr:hypothetical protein [Conexibacter sp. W3-3-2]
MGAGPRGRRARRPGALRRRPARADRQRPARRDRGPAPRGVGARRRGVRGGRGRHRAARRVGAALAGAARRRHRRRGHVDRAAGADRRARRADRAAGDPLRVPRRGRPGRLPGRLPADLHRAAADLPDAREGPPAGPRAAARRDGRGRARRRRLGDRAGHRRGRARGAGRARRAPRPRGGARGTPGGAVPGAASGGGVDGDLRRRAVHRRGGRRDRADGRGGERARGPAGGRVRDRRRARARHRPAPQLRDHAAGRDPAGDRPVAARLARPRARRGRGRRRLRGLHERGLLVVRRARGHAGALRGRGRLPPPVPGVPAHRPRRVLPRRRARRGGRAGAAARPRHLDPHRWRGGRAERGGAQRPVPGRDGADLAAVRPLDRPRDLRPGVVAALAGQRRRPRALRPARSAVPVVSRRRPLAALALVALAVAGCGGGEEPTRTQADPRQPAAATPVLAALAALPDGGYLTGELASGIVRREPGATVLARLPVRTGGQRGLLGLAATPDGRTVWASYTSARDGGRLVVERLRPAPRTRVWTGPVGTALATGGHLLHDPDRDRLVVGVGDLQDPPRVRDPRALNGKLLALDPDGPPDQRPRVLSGGWNNPFAFDRTPRGRLLVADNAPGSRPERIGPGDGTGGPVTDLPGRIAPSGVAALGERRLAVCGVVSGRLDRFEQPTPDAPWRRTGVLDRDCRYGVVRLGDGRLLVSGARDLHLVDPSGRTP